MTLEVFCGKTAQKRASYTLKGVFCLSPSHSHIFGAPEATQQSLFCPFFVHWTLKRCGQCLVLPPWQDAFSPSEATSGIWTVASVRDEPALHKPRQLWSLPKNNAKKTLKKSSSSDVSCCLPLCCIGAYFGRIGSFYLTSYRDSRWKSMVQLKSSFCHFGVARFFFKTKKLYFCPLVQTN